MNFDPELSQLLIDIQNIDGISDSPENGNGVTNLLGGPFTLGEEVVVRPETSNAPEPVLAEPVINATRPSNSPIPTP